LDKGRGPCPFSPNKHPHHRSSVPRVANSDCQEESASAHKAQKFKRSNGIGVVEYRSIASISSSNQQSSSNHGVNQVRGVPSYTSLLLFVGTTILIWLSDPLLSLIDTMVVGQTVPNAIVQLASLGPATLLTDSLIYLTYFLAIAATNTMANAQTEQDYSKLQKSSSELLGVAACLGGLVSIIVFGWGRPLLGWFSGSAGQSPELVSLALQYSKIRSSVAPLTVMGWVAQSICLATLDTTTPALAVVAASVMNLVGDLFLVAGCGLGTQGAAMATAGASVTSALVLLRQVSKKCRKWRQLQQQQDGSRIDVPGSSSTTNTTSNPTQHLPPPREGIHEQQEVPFVSLPSRSDFGALLRLAGPIFAVRVGMIVCYSSMTMRATAFGMAALACHNIMTRIFFLCAILGDSLSQASQTFVPRVLAKRITASNRDDYHKKRTGLVLLMRRLLTLSAIVGLFNCNFSRFLLTRCGGVLTKEVHIQELMKQRSFFASLSLLLQPFVLMFEGAIIGSRDLGFLVGTLAVTMGLLLGQLNLASASFAGVWRAWFCFHVIRLFPSSFRFLRKNLTRKMTPSPSSVA